MSLNEKHVRDLLEALGNTRDDEIDCETFLEHVAAYAEARRRGDPLPARFDAVVLHERLCPSCREECAAIAAVIADADTKIP